MATVKELKPKDFQHLLLTDAKNTSSYIFWRLIFKNTVTATEGYEHCFSEALPDGAAGTDVQNRKEEQLVRLLQNIVTDPKATTIVQVGAAQRGSRRGYNILLELDGVFMPSERQYILLLKQVMNEPMTLNEDLEAYVLRLRRLIAELESCGGSIQEDEVVGLIEIGLRLPEFEFERKMLQSGDRCTSIAEVTKKLRRTNVANLTVETIGSAYLGGASSAGSKAGTSQDHSMLQTLVASVTALTTTVADMSKTMSRGSDQVQPRGNNVPRGVCRDFLRGNCTWSNCKFSHDLSRANDYNSDRRPICDYCNKVGHTRPRCHKMEADRRQAAAQQGHPSRNERAPDPVPAGSALRAVQFVRDTAENAHVADSEPSAFTEWSFVADVADSANAAFDFFDNPSMFTNTNDEPRREFLLNNADDICDDNYGDVAAPCRALPFDVFPAPEHEGDEHHRQCLLSHPADICGEAHGDTDALRQAETESEAVLQDIGTDSPAFDVFPDSSPRVGPVEQGTPMDEAMWSVQQALLEEAAPTHCQTPSPTTGPAEDPKGPLSAFEAFEDLHRAQVIFTVKAHGAVGVNLQATRHVSVTPGVPCDNAYSRLLDTRMVSKALRPPAQTPAQRAARQPRQWAPPIFAYRRKQHQPPLQWRVVCASIINALPTTLGEYLHATPAGPAAILPRCLAQPIYGWIDVEEGVGNCATSMVHTTYLDDVLVTSDLSSSDCLRKRCAALRLLRRRKRLPCSPSGPASIGNNSDDNSRDDDTTRPEIPSENPLMEGFPLDFSDTDDDGNDSDSMPGLLSDDETSSDATGMTADQLDYSDDSSDTDDDGNDNDSMPECDNNYSVSDSHGSDDGFSECDFSYYTAMRPEIPSENPLDLFDSDFSDTDDDCNDNDSVPESWSDDETSETTVSRTTNLFDRPNDLRNTDDDGNDDKSMPKSSSSDDETCDAISRADNVENNSLEGMSDNMSHAAYMTDIAASQPPMIRTITTIAADIEPLLQMSKPIHYLGLCSGATFAIISALADTGRTLGRISLCEQDPSVRMVAARELLRLHRRYPQAIPLSAIDQSHDSLPQDVTQITAEHIGLLPPVDLIVATPDCQPFSTAGERKGFDDPRAASMMACTEVINTVYQNQRTYANWIIENVPGAAHFPEILHALGRPIMAKAHHLGSTSRRDTLLWTNLRDIDFLKQHYATYVRPPLTVGSMLAKYGFAPRWTAPPRLHNGVLPKLLSRKHSNAYRMHGDMPGRGMLIFDGKWREPISDIRACAMGFPIDTATLPDMDENLRHRILGGCLDANIGRWLVAALLSAKRPETALPSVHSLIGQYLIFDTGATRHLNAHRSEFLTYEPTNIWINGLCAYAIGVGDVQHVLDLVKPETTTTTAITLRRVLHVPELLQRSGGSVQRLFSWTAAKEQNPALQLNLGSTHSGLMLPNGDVIPIRSYGRLFAIDIKAPAVTFSSCGVMLSAAEKASKTIWHLRLGHLNGRSLDKLLDADVDGLSYCKSDDISFCTACAKVKSTVAARPRACVSKPDVPYYMVGMDYWENRTPSIQGNTYTFGAICYTTSLVFLRFSRSRSTAPACLRALIAEVETRGYGISVLRLDNDSVFRSAEFIAICEQHRIRREYSAPYSQFQNGLQERTWRTLASSAFCMIAHAGLTLDFWEYAMCTAWYLFERSIRATGNIPIRTLQPDRNPDLSVLRVFGCPAFVHQDPSTRRKGDPAAREGIFVGYSRDSRGWLVYFPDTRSTVTSRSVQFHELWKSPPGTISVEKSAVSQEGIHRPPTYSDSDSSDDDSGDIIDPTRDTTPDAPAAPAEPATTPVPPTPTPTQPPPQAAAPGQSSPSSAPATHPQATAPTPPPSHGPSGPTPGELPQPPLQPAAPPTHPQTTDPAPPSPIPGSPSPPLLEPAETLQRQSWRHSYRIWKASQPQDLPQQQQFQEGQTSPHPQQQQQQQQQQFQEGQQSHHRQPQEQPSQEGPSSSRNEGMNWALVATSDQPVEPTTLEQALNLPEAEDWMVAVNEEISSLKNRETWILGRLPPGRRAVKCKWVFKIKFNSDGTIARYKARLVAKGYSQVYGIDFTETFSPTVKFTTLRVLFSIAAHLDLHMMQTDVDCAFLYASLSEELFMEQPEGFEEQGPNGERLVCLLKKAVYGLKQAPHEWHKLLNEFMEAQNLRQLLTDPGAYILEDGDIIGIVAVYVDDIIVFSSCQKWMQTFKKNLGKAFSIKDLGEPAWILGMSVVRSPEDKTITIHQQKYINDLLQRFDMVDCNSVGVPSLENDPRESPPLEDVSLYRQLIGSLLYAAIATRPDISEAVSRLCRAMNSPTQAHLADAKHILKYLSGTSTIGITFGGAGAPFLLEGWVDANHATMLSSGKATSGYCFTLCGGAVSYRSKLQSCVTLSTAESEYIALSVGTAEATYLRQLLRELNFPQNAPTPIGEDNAAALTIATTTVVSQRTRHLDIRYHFVRDAIRRGIVAVYKISTSLNIADMFTKALRNPKFLDFSRKCMGALLGRRRTHEEGC